MSAPRRKWMYHDTPSWVDADASDYFITICCQQRGANQLCTPTVGPTLLAAARCYHERRKWLPSIFLLMPDHLHMIVGFGRGYSIPQIIGAWKHYTASRHGIVWQRNFFEHRLRSNVHVEDRVEYILQNPVRAGLTDRPEEWPYMWTIDDWITPR